MSDFGFRVICGSAAKTFQRLTEPPEIRHPKSVLSRLGEVHSPGAVNLLSGHGNRALFITSDGRQDVDDVQRITGTQLGAAVREADFPQVLAAIALQDDVSA